MIPDPSASRVWRAVALLAVLAVAILACTRDERDAAPAGKRRIVVVGGAIAETVFALGAGDEVVAADTSSVFPSELRSLPKVGYQRTLSAEGILSLKPDLVLAADEAGPPAVIEQLTRAGVRVERMPNALDIAAAARRIRTIGAALGRPADALAAKVEHDATAAAARAPANGPRFVMMFARGAGSMMVAGDRTSGAAMVALAGGRPAVSGFEGYKAISAEALVAAAPDVIVVPQHTLTMSGGIDGILKLPGVALTPAGKARRVVAFDDLLLLGFGPRLATAIDDLSRLLRESTQT